MGHQQMKTNHLSFVAVAAFSGLAALVSQAFAQVWMQTSAPPTNWSCVASSADGMKLAAGSASSFVSGKPIYTSADGGVTWQPTTAPGLLWDAVASSADGSKLVAAAYGSGIYNSTDS